MGTWLGTSSFLSIYMSAFQYQDFFHRTPYVIGPEWVHVCLRGPGFP